MSETWPCETHDWLRGELLAAWILDRFPEFSPELISHSFQRRWSDWRKGCTVSYVSADAVLVKLGCHLQELPDEFWVGAAPQGAGKGKRISKEIRAAALKEDGPPHLVAQKFNIKPRTLRSWRAKEAA